MTIRGTYAVGAALIGMVGFQAAVAGFGRPVPAPAEPLSQERTMYPGPFMPPHVHPDWVRVSGEVEETVIMKPDGQPDQLLALLKLVEGGRVGVDLGPAEKSDMIRLGPRDLIHVWGSMLRHGTARTIIAGEVLTEGRVIQIERTPNR